MMVYAAPRDSPDAEERVDPRTPGERLADRLGGGGGGGGGDDDNDNDSGGGSSDDPTENDAVNNPAFNSGRDRTEDPSDPVPSETVVPGGGDPANPTAPESSDSSSSTPTLSDQQVLLAGLGVLLVAIVFRGF